MALAEQRRLDGSRLQQELGDSGNFNYRIKLMADQVRELFGAVPDNLDDFALASQISQAEAKKFFIEMFRTGQPNRTGIIWWNLIDGWPQFSDAVVDYYFRRKLAFYYIKRVQQPLILSMREPANWNLELVSVNDAGAEAELDYTVTELTTGEVVHSARATVPKGVKAELCPQKWTFGHTKTDTYRFKEQFHRFETVMPETRYVDDVSH